MYLVRSINDLVYIDELELVRPRLNLVWYPKAQGNAEYQEPVFWFQLLLIASRDVICMERTWIVDTGEIGGARVREEPVPQRHRTERRSWG